MPPLERIITRRPGPAQHGSPVLEPAIQRKGPVPLRADELVTVDVLPRRLPARHEEDVVRHERDGVQERDEPVDDHRERDAQLPQRRPETRPVAVRAGQELPQRREREVQPQQRRRRDEGEEVAVVAAADAVVEPHAVVVVRLDAVVAEAAVVRARGPPDVAGAAVLDGDLHGRRGLVGGLDEVPVRRRGTDAQGVVVFCWGELVEVARENLVVR